MLPNFLCVGAQKAGTTSLHDILRQHPDIYLPEEKESQFFQNENLYQQGISFYEKEFFSQWKRERAVGEVDPQNLYYEVIPERICEKLGNDVKLIFMFREPVSRAYSHYLMSVRRGYEKETFLEGINREDDRIKRDDFSKSHFSYITRGLYAKQVKPFLRLFPHENMFFILFEEFVGPGKRIIINDLLSFLDIEKVKLNLDVKSNPSQKVKLKSVRDFLFQPSLLKSAMKLVVPAPKFRRKLKKNIDAINLKPFTPPQLSKTVIWELQNEYFVDEIHQLGKIIERNLDFWLVDKSN